MSSIQDLGQIGSLTVHRGPNSKPHRTMQAENKPQDEGLVLQSHLARPGVQKLAQWCPLGQVLPSGSTTLSYTDHPLAVSSCL